MNGYTSGAFLDKIKDRFEIIPMGQTACRPESGKVNSAFTAAAPGTDFRSGTAPPAADPVKNLDVSILQDYILDPVLGIRNPKADPRHPLRRRDPRTGCPAGNG